MKTCALIPAYNEAEQIASVVTGARNYVDAVVVIDDGSYDSTTEVAREAGAYCIVTPVNQGKASALRRGFDYARKLDFTHVVTLDGDGQHLPEDIPGLLEKALETDADLVVGTRPFVRHEMPTSRYYSNTIGSRWASALVGQAIHDSQSGFRVLRLDSLKKLNLRSTRYGFEMEVLIKMGRAGMRIAHAPIHRIYDNGQARSKMNPVRDTIHICLWALAFRFLGA